ncbi:hypothetical protein ACFYWX_23285 [Streptomyces sp. NPDC002888]|uniref:hypothetical protein n=1 Tax=Streptomyces sp. NPDC002888 TaxID=3364668 RepID=UPI003675CDE3
MTTRSPESRPNTPAVFPTEAPASSVEPPGPEGTQALGAAEPAQAAQAVQSEAGPSPLESARVPSWPTWLTVAALAICGAAHFPTDRDGASLQIYGFAFGASVLCVLLALLLTFRSATLLLAGAVVAPAALVAAELFQDQWHSAGLSRALGLALAPPWLATLTAVLATLTALFALLAAQPAGRRPTPSLRPLINRRP